MKYILQSLIAVSLIASLSACAPYMTKEQCMTTNWYQVGQNDANNGRYQQNLSKAIQACAKYKIPVNSGQYDRGYDAGLHAFCTASRGMRLGVIGGAYNDICPSNLRGQFIAGYKKGLRRYCVPRTGYKLGRHGQPLPNFCAADQVTAFRDAYDSGAQLFKKEAKVRGKVNAINAEIAATKATIDRLMHDNDSMQKNIVADFPAIQKNKDKQAARAIAVVQLAKNELAIQQQRNHLNDLVDEQQHYLKKLEKAEDKGND